MLLLPTLNPPSARRTLRGADFRGISRYITIIIRSIILGDGKGAGRRRDRRKLLPASPRVPSKTTPLCPPPPPSPSPPSRIVLACLSRAANFPGFDSDRPKPIFDNSRSFHRGSVSARARIIPRTYIFHVDLITRVYICIRTRANINAET